MPYALSNPIFYSLADPPTQPTADDEASDAEEDVAQAAATQRQRQQASPGTETPDYIYGDEDTQGDASLDQMVKKLVRFALACEYARQPIRRADISAKGE